MWWRKYKTQIILYEKNLNHLNRQKIKAYIFPSHVLRIQKINLIWLGIHQSQCKRRCSGCDNVPCVWFRVRTVCGTYSITHLVSVEQPPPTKVKVHLALRGSAHCSPCAFHDTPRPQIDMSQPATGAYKTIYFVHCKTMHTRIRIKSCEAFLSLRERVDEIWDIWEWIDFWNMYFSTPDINSCRDFVCNWREFSRHFVCI